MKSNLKPFLIFISIVLLIGFNYPFISIADKPKTILGLPSIYIYLFSAWALGIFIVYIVTVKYKEDKQ